MSHSSRRRHLAPFEYKEGADDPLAAIRALGATLEEKFGLMGDEVKKLRDQLDQEIVKRNRPGAENKGEGNEVEVKAFATFLRKGDAALTADEIKALRVADDTTGGYLAPPEFSAEVDKNLVQFSPVRAAARVGQTSAGSVIIPRRTSKPTASWVGETETRPATASTYGQVEIPVDINAEVSFDLAEEFGRLEGAALVSGDGVKKPLGFMSDTNVAYNVSGSASVIADADGGVDGLIDLMYALHPFYRSRGVWMANGTTIGKLRKLKDADKNYIWAASIRDSEPATLLGRPIIEAPDMPDIAGGAVFGDFATAFRIYDRVGMSFLVDPYTQAASGLTRIHARKRVGGRLVQPEAIRKLKIGTSSSMAGAARSRRRAALLPLIPFHGDDNARHGEQCDPEAGAGAGCGHRRYRSGRRDHRSAGLRLPDLLDPDRHPGRCRRDLDGAARGERRQRHVRCGRRRRYRSHRHRGAGELQSGRRREVPEARLCGEQALHAPHDHAQRQCRQCADLRHGATRHAVLAPDREPAGLSRRCARRSSRS